MESRVGFAILEIKGKSAYKIFKNEAGGHRWQRVPPTETRGRKHTSTITVSVIPEIKISETKIRDRDIEEKFVRGSGAGGQHRNKTSTAVVLKHIPTGIVVRVETNKSQIQNRELALSILYSKLENNKQQKAQDNLNKMRRNQIGTGLRGDKIRTIQVKNNQVVCHLSGKKTSYKKYKKGDFSDLK